MFEKRKSIVYLDNAATTFPKPTAVVDETLRAVKYACGNPGRSSHRLAMRAAEVVYDCRSRIASLVGGAEENVVFTSSATHSINLGVKTLLRRGDHVLISDIEHNSVIRPIAALAQKGLITYGIYRAESDPEEAVASVSAMLRPETSMVIACQHSNICNLVQPIRAIGSLCRRNGVLLLVDAAQSAGVIDIDMERDGIDILCAPGHKGLYGVPGSGFAVFGRRFSEDGSPAISTFMEGGNGIRSRDREMPDFLPERLEAGTLAVPAIGSLKAGIEFLQRRGIYAVRRQESELYDTLCGGMSVLGDRIRIYGNGESGGILLFSVSGIPSEKLAEMLDDYGICVRAGLHCAPMAHAKLGTPEDGAVRVSFGAFNTQRDVFYLLNVLDHLLKR